MYESNNNTISNNDASNSWYSIYLRESGGNTIIHNNASNNLFYGICLEFSSNNNTITNNIASNNLDGIYLSGSSNNNTITNNSTTNNLNSFHLLDSINNTITNNNALNSSFGISLRRSSNNKIYLNNFTAKIYFNDSNNIWSSPEKINYIYKGGSFTNYMGNYWSDYTGSDGDDDGIGDIPCGTAFSINSDADNYPLMGPWENYF